MLKRLPLAIAVALIVSTFALAAPAHAHKFYGETAKKAAKKINCKDYRVNDEVENGRMGTCKLNGTRVNIFTFQNKAAQEEWNLVAKESLPSDHWYATGKGAAVTHKFGKKKPAKVAAKRMPGVLRHGTA